MYITSVVILRLNILPSSQLYYQDIHITTIFLTYHCGGRMTAEIYTPPKFDLHNYWNKKDMPCVCTFSSYCTVLQMLMIIAFGKHVVRSGYFSAHNLGCNQVIINNTKHIRSILTLSSFGTIYQPHQTNPSQTNVPSCRLGTKRKGQTSTLAGRTMILEAILRMNISHPQVRDKQSEWVHSMQRITLFESSRPPPPMRIVVLIVGLVGSVLWRNHSAEVGGWSRSETPFPSRILTRKSRCCYERTMSAMSVREN